MANLLQSPQRKQGKWRPVALLGREGCGGRTDTLEDGKEKAKPGCLYKALGEKHAIHSTNSDKVSTPYI